MIFEPIRMMLTRLPYRANRKLRAGAGRGFAIALVAATAALAACSLAANLDQFDGARPAASAVAAASDAAASPAALGDASGVPVNIPTSDSASPDALAADSSADGTSPPPSHVELGSWCATKSPVPMFCRDFDSLPLAALFTSTGMVACTATLTKVDSFSSPGSLLLQTDQLISNPASLPYDFRLPAFPSSLHFEYEIKFANAPEGRADLQRILLGVFPTEYGITMQVIDGQSAQVEEYDRVAGTTFNHALPRIPGVNGWTFVAIDVDFAKATLTVTFDKVVVIQGESLAIPERRTSVTVNTGLDYAPGPQSPFTMELDNILVSTP